MNKCINVDSVLNYYLFDVEKPQELIETVGQYCDKVEFKFGKYWQKEILFVQKEKQFIVRCGQFVLVNKYGEIVDVVNSSYLDKFFKKIEGEF